MMMSREDEHPGDQADSSCVTSSHAAVSCLTPDDDVGDKMVLQSPAKLRGIGNHPCLRPKACMDYR